MSNINWTHSAVFWALKVSWRNTFSFRFLHLNCNLSICERGKRLKKICPFSSNQLVCVQNLTGWHRLLLQLLSRQQFWALKSHIVQRSKEQGVLGLLVLTWLSWSLPLFTFLDLFSHVELLPFIEHYVWTLCWVFYIYNLIVLWLKDFGARFKS